MRTNPVTRMAALAPPAPRARLADHLAGSHVSAPLAHWPSRSSSWTCRCARPTTAGGEEYERRAEGVGAEKAAAIAVEISQDRREDERRPLEEKTP